ncbi:sensor histidine kinase [Reichenbachiella ulvae]|uniref:histidine kinase n=1 Tax=Reichenbachiella ulvae TaxID=2980104 RepID=A0ABT3CPJ1_9BACT|nr:GAF domain-containing sensor histidine kinase [Reichenbachiella ulvae]MCV9385444.1 GAF domain-containing sensor histidine kinase [Reichenbachiella ulvae]
MSRFNKADDRMTELEKRDAEKKRLNVLKSYSILDTPSDPDFDELTLLASQICGTSISLISFVDDDRQWFKSKVGLEAPQTPRTVSFCSHAIDEDKDIFIVPDARNHDNFKDNPLVTSDPYIVFYAGVPLHGEEDQPLGTLCVIDSETKTLSPQQIQSLKILAHQVENLLKLRKMNLNLNQAIGILENKNHQLDRFAMIAAHDIKSPLNNITALIEYLLSSHSEGMSKAAIETIKMIGKSSGNLKNLVDGLLSYSRHEEYIKQEKETIQLKTFIEDFLGLYSQQKGCRLNYKTDLDEIWVNKIALEQILINLISNAIKYGDKDETIIDILVSELDHHYLFEVKDNGPGIPDKAKTKIFELFQTLQSTDRNGQKGNGVGLATVKRLVESLDGLIELESSEGKGSTFRFTLAK